MSLQGGGRELTWPELSYLMVVVWEAARFRDDCLCGGIRHPPWQLLALTRDTGSSLVSALSPAMARSLGH